MRAAASLAAAGGGVENASMQNPHAKLSSPPRGLPRAERARQGRRLRQSCAHVNISVTHCTVKVVGQSPPFVEQTAVADFDV